jgi:hypothetical protein
MFQANIILFNLFKDDENYKIESLSKKDWKISD